MLDEPASSGGDAIAARVYRHRLARWKESTPLIHWAAEVAAGDANATDTTPSRAAKPTLYARCKRYNSRHAIIFS